MQKIFTLCAASLLLLFTGLKAQRIIYSEPDRDDPKSISFEIVGKMNGNILIYKNYRELHYISVLDQDLKLVEKNKLDFMPQKVSEMATRWNQQWKAYSADAMAGLNANPKK